MNDQQLKAIKDRAFCFASQFRDDDVSLDDLVDGMAFSEVGSDEHVAYALAIAIIKSEHHDEVVAYFAS